MNFVVLQAFQATRLLRSCCNRPLVLLLLLALINNILLTFHISPSRHSPVCHPYLFTRMMKSVRIENSSIHNAVPNRAAAELRPVFLRTAVSSTALGSSYIEIENTKVMVCVHGPLQIQRTSSTHFHSLPFTCRVSHTSFAQASTSSYSVSSANSTGNSHASSGLDDNQRKQFRGRFISDIDRDQSMAATVEASLAPVLDGLPRQLQGAFIEVHVLVLEDDGGTLAAAITAASLALADAGIQTTGLVVACSAALVQELDDVGHTSPAKTLSSTRAHQQQKNDLSRHWRLQLDPTTNQEQNASANLLIAWNSATNEFTHLEHYGQLTSHHLNQMLSMTIQGAQQLTKLSRDCCIKKLNKLL